MRPEDRQKALFDVQNRIQKLMNALDESYIPAEDRVKYLQMILEGKPFSDHVSNIQVGINNQKLSVSYFWNPDRQTLENGIA